jgi:hypothetical protein
MIIDCKIYVYKIWYRSWSTKIHMILHAGGDARKRKSRRSSISGLHTSRVSSVYAVALRTVWSSSIIARSLFYSHAIQLSMSPREHYRSIYRYLSLSIDHSIYLSQSIDHSIYYGFHAHLDCISRHDVFHWTKRGSFDPLIGFPDRVWHYPDPCRPRGIRKSISVNHSIYIPASGWTKFLPSNHSLNRHVWSTEVREGHFSYGQGKLSTSIQWFLLSSYAYIYIYR